MRVGQEGDRGKTRKDCIHLLNLTTKYRGLHGFKCETNSTKITSCNLWKIGKIVFVCARALRPESGGGLSTLDNGH